MIKKIHFKNFFSFQDTEIDLTDTNVLIGINGSGKTNFIRGLELLKAAAEGKLRDLILYKWGGINEIFFADNNNSRQQIEIGLNLTFRADLFKHNTGYPFEELKYSIRFFEKGKGYFVNEAIDYKLKRGKNKPEDFNYLLFDDGYGIIHSDILWGDEYRYEGFDGQESILSKLSDPAKFLLIEGIKNAFKNIDTYYGFDTRFSSEIRRPIIATSETKLLSNGGNLTQILNTLGINDRKSFKLIKEKLQEVNPNFEDIHFNFLGANIELMLAEKGFNRAIHVSKISDGTLKFLCLMAIFYNPNRGTVVCIDEPETGLHPDMISAVAEGIRHAAETSQMIIATHSDHLLDKFKLSDILVFEKNKQNATEVKRYTEDDFKDWYDEYTVGTMWRDGALGGNRW